MESLLARLSEEGRVPRLLLHSCCGPCSTYCIEYLSDYFSITVFYYNPNIFPEEEYLFRKAEQKRFIDGYPAKNPIDFIEGDYDFKRFYENVRGFEDEPERGARCSICFEMRLGESARVASQGGFDYFATTLTLSPHKDMEVINAIGKRCGEAVGAEYLPSDFKKKGGYLRSTQISAEYGMYRQDYCGCEFSLKSQDRPEESQSPS